MSYILEALNKSEQERRDNKTPNINTVHRPPPANTRRTPWLAIVLVFGVLNVAALAYWLTTDRDVTTAAAPASTPASATPSTPPSTPPSTKATAKMESETRIANPPQSNAGSNAPGTTRPTANAPVAATNQESFDQETFGAELITPQSSLKPSDRAVRITELPTNVQRQIPNLVFSSHLFSDDSSFRMVNINGKMIREGDRIADDLRLLEITEEGVVLGYLHYVFEVSVLRDWSFN